MLLFTLLSLLLSPASAATDANGGNETNWIATSQLWSFFGETETNRNDSDKTNFGSYGFYAYHEDATCTEDTECVDSLPNCQGIARLGECAAKWAECPKSCLTCHPADETRFPIGVPQEIPYNLDLDAEELSEFSQEDMMARMAGILTQTQYYMANTVHQDAKYNTVRRSCRNYNPYCAAYSAVGFCDDRFRDGEEYQWMITYCAPACLACEEYEIIQPCEANPAFNYYHDGDLSKMFERMVGERRSKTPLPDYQPVIHSRPGGGGGAGGPVDGPWVITLENFLTGEECDRLRELGNLEGYERSELQNEEEAEEYEDWRTSTNAWCEKECQSDPVAQEVIRRIGQATGIPHQYSESLQLLRYSPGQFYGEHHDNTDDGFLIDEGARMITFFLYLNDVEEGGATRMVDLKYAGEHEYPGEDENRTKVPLTVQPKKGMALVWPNINDENHHYKEEGTWHEALPVTKGFKFGANAWFRQRRRKSRCDEDAYYDWQRNHNLVDKDEEEKEDELAKKEVSSEKEYNVAVLEDDYSLIPDE